MAEFEWRAPLTGADLHRRARTLIGRYYEKDAEAPKGKKTKTTSEEKAAQEARRKAREVLLNPKGFQDVMARFQVKTKDKIVKCDPAIKVCEYLINHPIRLETDAPDASHSSIDRGDVYIARDGSVKIIVFRSKEHSHPDSEPWTYVVQQKLMLKHLRTGLNSWVPGLAVHANTSESVFEKEFGKYSNWILCCAGLIDDTDLKATKAMIQTVTTVRQAKNGNEYNSPALPSETPEPLHCFRLGQTNSSGGDPPPLERYGAKDLAKWLTLVKLDAYTFEGLERTDTLLLQLLLDMDFDPMLSIVGKLPRNKEEIQEWVEFLRLTRAYIFFWEWMWYKDAHGALRRSGLKLNYPNDDVAEDILHIAKLKKNAMAISGATAGGIPSSEFAIENPEQAFRVWQMKDSFTAFMEHVTDRTRDMQGSATTPEEGLESIWGMLRHPANLYDTGTMESHRKQTEEVVTAVIDEVAKNEARKQLFYMATDMKLHDLYGSSQQADPGIPRARHSKPPAVDQHDHMWLAQLRYLNPWFLQAQRDKGEKQMLQVALVGSSLTKEYYDEERIQIMQSLGDGIVEIVKGLNCSPNK